MEKGYEKFKDIVKECANHLFDVRHVCRKKKLVWQWPKREVLLRNGCSEELRIYLQVPGTESCYETGF